MHPLSILNELSNIDKHRAIPVLALVASHADFKINSTEGIANCGQFKLGVGKAIKQGAVLATCDITPDGSGTDPKMDVKAHISCDIAFGRGDVPSSVQHKPVVLTFAQSLGQFVSQTIVALAAQDGLSVTPTPLPGAK
jgi:hypothetical protein